MFHKVILEKFANNAHLQLVHDLGIQIESLYANKQPDVTERIRSIGFQATVEEATYTWFNRVIALRFFELHDYFPSQFDSTHLWDNTDNLKKACAELAKCIPQLFSSNTKYLSRLELDSFFLSDGLISNLLKIPTDDFAQVEIIGWLYQYYNSSYHSTTIAAKKPYQKHEIPLATQIFTPDWITKYLVENSLGRFYFERTHDAKTREEWQFYISDLDKNETKNIISPEHNNKTNVDPRNIRLLDPCCGSGHILAYAFDVFYQIYLAGGYPASKIPSLILENNLFGLEIDDRAAQLATIVVLLKARSYDSKIFQNPTAKHLNILAIPESNQVGRTYIKSIHDPAARNDAEELFDFFVEAKNLGALLIAPAKEFTALENYLATSQINSKNQRTRNILLPMLKTYQLLSQKYQIVVTNPPYIKRRFMNQILKSYIKDNFPSAQTDLFAAMIKRCTTFLPEKSKNSADSHYFAFMTPSIWLHTSQFAEFRQEILQNYCITSLIQPYSQAFFSDAAVQICTFVLRDSVSGTGKYLRIEEMGDMDQQKNYFKQQKYQTYIYQNQDFLRMPENAILFWLDPRILQLFSDLPSLSEYAAVKQGMITGDNQRFIRFWFEVDPAKLDQKWLPHNKGGEYRKWYGNREYVIDWQQGGEAIRKFSKDSQIRSRAQNLSFNFQPAIGWSSISQRDFSARYYDESFTFNTAGSCCFPAPNNYEYLLGLLNSCVAQTILSSINPSLNYNVGDVSKLPVFIDEDSRPEIESLVRENLKLAQQDWDSFELSRDFQLHPLLKYQDTPTVSDAFSKWQAESKERFEKVKTNEEKLDQIFTKHYHLEDYFNSMAPSQKTTIRLADQKRETKSLLSYFIGTLCGRLGLAQNSPRSQKLRSKDRDNSSPLFVLSLLRTDSSINYFDSNCCLIKALQNFLKQHFAADQLASNLDYIAETLGQEFAETSTQAILRYFREKFFSDHVKLYRGRPIYWFFEISPKHDFCALAYCRNIQTSTLTELRDKYIKPLYGTYNSHLQNLIHQLQDETLKGNRSWLEKQISVQKQKNTEIATYLKQLEALILERPQFDFDLGVIPNYKKLQPLLAKLPRSCSGNGKRDII